VHIIIFLIISFAAFYHHSLLVNAAFAQINNPKTPHTTSSTFTSTTSTSTQQIQPLSESKLLPVIFPSDSTTDSTTSTTNSTKSALDFNSTKSQSSAQSPNWKILHIENNTGITKIIEHKFVRQNKNQINEQIKLYLPNKSSVSLGHTIGYPSLIDELDPSVQICANDCGIILAAQIVLPHSIHPQTRKPITFIVAGSAYTSPNHWETLNFHDQNGKPNLWQRADKILIPLRAELNNLDLREKYVRQLVLFIEPVPNNTNYKVVNIGQLNTTGVLPTRDEFQNTFEKYNNQINSLFDPINFNGFKLLASSQCEFLTTHVTNSEWIEKIWGFNPDKLVSTPLSPQPFPQTSPQTSPQTFPQPSPQPSPQLSPQPSPQFFPQTFPQTSPQLSSQPSPIKFNPHLLPNNINSTNQNLNQNHNQTQTHNQTQNLNQTQPVFNLQSHSRIPERNTGFNNNSRTLYPQDNSNSIQKFTLLQQNNTGINNIISENQNFQPSATTIQISDKILLVNNIPIGVRAIEYQGEPLAFLRKLEFNTVLVKERPSLSLLREAREAGVWLICKPPSPNEIANSKIYNDSTPLDKLQESDMNISIASPIYDNVLAWNLGDDCTQPRHQEDTNRITLLQSADRIRRRPIICTARSGVWEYSRIVDVLLMESQPLLSSLDFNELALWQSGYQTLARPDTPFWTTIQTDIDPKVTNQWIMFGGNTHEICAITHEQIKMQVHQALACGVHGIIFTSNSPLTNNDPVTEYRRTSLELINWELQLIEDWFAGGRDQPTLVKSTGRSQMNAAILQAGRTRLLVPIWQERNSQLAVSGAFEGSVQFIIPGIPDTYGAYLIVPNRMFPLTTRRVAGGTEVLLDEISLNSLVYFGEVDGFYARIGERAKIIGERCAYLACRLAELQLASMRQVMETLKQAKESNSIPIHPRDKLPLIALQEQESHFRMTNNAINIAKSFINQSPPAYGMAYLQAERSTRGLRVIARDILREATRHDLNICMTPVSVSFATLPYYLSAFQRTSGAILGQNRLSGGDMEDIGSWQRSGWTSQRHKIEGIVEQLSIAQQASRTGMNGLRMITQMENNESKPKQIETSPIWVISPPVGVRMGEMICVNGWIKIPVTLESGVDGLTIFDSLGGEPLALRFRETQGQWKEFAFYRYVPEDSNYYVYFALNSLGEVHIDDIRISAVQFNQPRPNIPDFRPTPTLPTLPRIPIDRLNPFQYLPNLTNLPNINGTTTENNK
jgi:hypothetical protein